MALPLYSSPLIRVKWSGYKFWVEELWLGFNEDNECMILGAGYTNWRGDQATKGETEKKGTLLVFKIYFLVASIREFLFTHQNFSVFTLLIKDREELIFGVEFVEKPLLIQVCGWLCGYELLQGLFKFHHCWSTKPSDLSLLPSCLAWFIFFICLSLLLLLFFFYLLFFFWVVVWVMDKCIDSE